MKKKKILLICPVELDILINKDIKILKKYYDVSVFVYRGKKDRFKLLKAVLETDLNISWFSWTYTRWAIIFSKIFRKKTIVIAAGYDAVNMPEINYGAMRNAKSAKIAKYGFENADKVIAVSNSIRDGVLQYTNRKDVKTVYHAFDYNKFKPDGPKEGFVITVGNVNKSNLQRKGLETFVKAAQYLPDVRFVLIGKHLDDSIDYLRSIAAPNVEFTGWVSDEKLLGYMQKAKVYVQVSYHEGFGLSIAEAMLCECVPVVTDRGAIPEVVGETGFYVPFGDAKTTAEAIKKAMESNLGKKARERIKTLFPLEKREKELIDAVEGLIAN